jgi:hypothetical protein
MTVLHCDNFTITIAVMLLKSAGQGQRWWKGSNCTAMHSMLQATHILHASLCLTIIHTGHQPCRMIYRMLAQRLH